VSAVVGALRVSLGLDTAAFQNGLKNANSRLKTFGQQAAKIGAALSVVSTGLALGLKGQLQAADDLGKTAQKIGIPVDALSKLAYAADLSGVSMSSLQTGVGRLARSMSDARDGMATAVDAFARIGVAATNADGSLRPTEDVLADVADAFARMPDGAEKTATAMELLGRGGADMIPLLNGGADALRAMADEAERMGLVISEDTFRAAEIFNDNVTRLTKSVGALGTMITAELAPVLAAFSERIVALVQRFQGLSPEMRKFLSVGTLIGVALGPVVTAIGLLAIGFAAIGAPIALAVAGIGALTAAAVAFWPQIMAAKDAVIAFGRDALDWIKAKPAEIAAAFRAVVADMRQIGVDIIAGLWDGLRERWETVRAGITGFASGIANIFRSETQTQSPSRVMMAVGQDIMAGLGLGLKAEQAGIETGLQSFASGIARTFEDILTGTASFNEGFRSLLAQSLGQAGSGLINAGIGGIFGGLGIPGFARGTRFAPGGLALVGERGPELVNLPRGSQVIPNNAMGNGSMDVRVYVDQGGNWQAAVERISGGVAARVTQQAVGAYDRALPDRLARVNADPWRRG
jgi:phage-related tail protein